MNRLAALLAACLLAGCVGKPARPDHPSVLLVTLDTTRADHVGAYGAKGAATPAFDRLANEGTLFIRATTVAPLTTPAHASLMTGLYPFRHGVRNNGRVSLPESITTLAEVFAAKGYRTAAFVGAFPVSRTFGFAQGFQTFDDDFGDDREGQVRSERTAGEVNGRALGWLSSAKQPFFAWIHYYDAHEPYEPPAPFAARFARSPYDGEIAYADSQLEQIIETLRKTGALDRTIVAVAGDHGEGLGEHGEFTHGLLIYEPMLHVPMVIRAPWTVATGGRRDDLVSLVDLAPTLAALAGVPAPASLDGRDLFGAAPPGGEAVYAESVFAAEEFAWAPLSAARRGSTKWIAAPRPERYDLDADPAESHNLAGTDAPRDEQMSALLARIAVSGSAEGAAAGGPLDDEAQARLESLGYVGGGGGASKPARGAGVGGRDPKDAIRDYVAYQQGTDLILRKGDAVPIFERLVAGDPENPEFRLRLGQAYLKRRDPASAEAAYRELLHRYPDFYLAYRRLCTLLASQGRHAESRDLWLQLQGRNPSYIGLDKRIAEALLGTGENERALGVSEKGLTRAPDDAELAVLSGRALERLGREGEALDRYRTALASRPSSTEALDGAIALLRRLGKVGEIRGLVEDCLARSAGNAAVRERLKAL